MGPSAIEGREPFFAVVFSLVWLLGLGAYGAGYFGLIGEGVEPAGPVSLEIMLFTFAAILPNALVWMGVLLLRRSAEIQRDARDLTTALRKFQTDPLANRTARITPAGSGQVDAETKAKIDALAEQIQQMELALSNLGNISGAPVMPTETDQQGTVTEQNSIGTTSPNWRELLHALNFPQDEKDKAGFRALRIAMRHKSISRCIRAAEDIMNLMAKDGIYMDDFTPEIAPAELWRAFSDGMRGEQASALGGINDEVAIEKIRERLNNETIFRDAALHFQRNFDVVLKLFCEQGSDSYIEKLGNTRTGRTFMLLGQVNGMFG